MTITALQLGTKIEHLKHPLGVMLLCAMAQSHKEPLVDREKLASLGPKKISQACDLHARAAAAAMTPEELERHIHLLAECVYVYNQIA